MAMADGRPTMAAGSGPPPLVVRPHRPRIRRLLAMHAGSSLLILPSFLLVVLGDREGWDVAFPASFVVYWAVLSACITFMWGRLVAADALMEVGPWGIRVNDLGRGWVSLPWDAVGAARKDLWGRLVVKPAEGVDPSTPGTEWPPDTATARRARRWGFKVPGRVVHPDASTVIEAVHHFSGGRF